MEWKLYHKDGTPLRDTNGKEISVHSLIYDGEWMGECSVSVSIENEAPIGFSIGDYLIYRNERFELNYDPGKAKQGRKNALGDSFKYSDIKLNSLSDELARAEFLDVVLNDEAQLHYTALPNFVFYIGSLDDLLDRLQANMDEQFGDKAWKFYSRNWKRSQTRGCEAARWEEIYGGDTTKEDTGVSDTEIDSTSISVQNQTVWEGLALVNSQFDVNFITRNREVFVDASGLLMQNTFKYGAAFGLVEINQDAESDQKIVTRMRAYGSEKNLPNRYYATLNMEVWADLLGTVQVIDNTTWYATDLKLGGLSVEKAAAYFTNHISDGQGSSRYYVSLHDGSVVVKATITVCYAPYFEEHIEVRIAGGTDEENTIADVKKYYEAVNATKMVHFVSGVNKDAFPDNKKDYATNHLPNNMACSRLMLPGFPHTSLQDWWDSHKEKHAALNPTGAELRFSTRADRPWVESAAADTIGVRSGSVFFDTEDIKEKKEEIFPTIKEMTVDGVRIDEIAVGTSVDDNGVFKDEQDPPSCKVELNEKVNFDINALKQSDFSITMTDGMCAGRKFKVSGSVKENGRWVLTLERVKDVELYFPYKDFQINKGDHFVLSGIELPVQYVEAASERLLRNAIVWLIENDHTRHTYAPKIYDIFMARQHDEAMADTSGATKSIHDTIKEGDIMPFRDDDLGLNAEVIIDKLTIKEEEGKIPTYEITLRDDKEVSTLQKIQEQITAIANGGGGGGSVTAAQVKEYVASEGGKYFLSKVRADTAMGLINFAKGLVSKETASLHEGAQFGESFADGQAGFGGKIDGRGVGYLESLTLRSFLEAPEYRFNRISIKVGNEWRAPGGGVIERVEIDHDAEGNELQSGTAYLHLEDGEIGKIAIDDICQGIWHDQITLSNNDADDYDDSKGNFRFAGFYTAYFRIDQVLSLNGGTNNAFHYTLRAVNKDWSSTKHPASMMHFVAYGNFTDKTRQSSRYSTLTYERYLKDVNDWMFTEDNIAAQFGDLSNLKVFGLDMTGYSAYLNNIYMSGTIQQFVKLGRKMHIDQSLGGYMAPGEVETVTVSILDGYMQDHTEEYTFMVERDTGDTAADNVWNAMPEHLNCGSSFRIAFEDLHINPNHGGISTLFHVTADNGKKEERVSTSIEY